MADHSLQMRTIAGAASGTEITRIDLDDAAIGAARRASLDHPVLFFRGGDQRR